MSALLRRIFGAPVLATEEETLQAGMLFRVVWATVGAVGLGTGLLVLLEPATFTRRVVSALIVAALGMVVVEVSRHARPRLASWLLVVGLVAVPSVRAFTAGGVSAPQANGYVILVLLAGALLGMTSGVIVAVACIAISFAFVWVQARGQLPPSEIVLTPLAIALYGVLWISLGIVLQYQVAWGLRRALRRAEAELHEREQAQAKLERSYAELRESEDKFSRVFHSVPAGLALSRVEDGRFLEVNDEFERLYGWSRDEVIGHTSSELGMWVDPLDRDRMLGGVKAGQREQRDLELRLRGKDGRERVMRTSVQVLDVQGDKVMVSAFIDLTERLRAENALRVSDRKFGAIFQASPVPLTVTEAESGRFVAANQAYLDQVGAESAEALIGKTRIELGLLTADERRRIIDSLVDGEGRRMILQLRRLDGTPFTAEGSIGSYELDGKRYILTSTLDVSDRVRAEQEREASMYALGERVKELRLLHQTASLLQQPHASIEELLSRWIALVPSAWQFPECCEARIAYRDTVAATAGWRESPWRMSATFSTSDGAGVIDVVYLEEKPPSDEGPFLAEERTLIGSVAEMLVGHFELLRHREGLEELVVRRTRELAAAKDEADRANRAKSTFLATMSHEIRTPMNAILGYTQMLRRDRSLDEAQRRKVEVILTSGDHLLTLINNVLEMSRIEAGRSSLTLQPVDPRALLEGVEQMFAAAAAVKGLELSVDAPPDLPVAVRADAGKVRQVVINLVGNAIKFTEHGGIMVRASSERIASGYRITVAVEDTGPGISAEELPRIFGAFEQLGLGVRIGGSGLGLAISREFAELMGGDLAVTSSPGKGSTFSFTFKVEEATSDELVRTSSDDLPVGIAKNRPSPRILVVDDQFAGREVAREVLAGIGFDARVAASGEEAIQVHDAWRPDLILMDLRMPGIGGLEAIRRLRLAGSKCILIAFTASSVDDAPAESKAAGADGILLKPYREADLFGMLEERLGVEYEYAPAEPPLVAVVPHASGGSIAEGLRAVPRDVLDSLKTAALQARAKRIGELLVDVAAHSSDAAAQIRTLVKDFRYDALVTAVDEATGEA